MVINDHPCSNPHNNHTQFRQLSFPSHLVNSYIQNATQMQGNYQMNNTAYDYSMSAMSSTSLYSMSGKSGEEPVAGPSSLVHRRRSSAGSGSRKRSPDSLISPDAPTQPRKYTTPSATSKKEVPAFFAKRYPPQGSDEEEDELTEEPPAANATDQEKIEWRRRQNTLAARRSRKRKLLQQQHLEEMVERLTREKEVWRTRALTLRQLLHSHGILCPDFKD